MHSQILYHTEKFKIIKKTKILSKFSINLQNSKKLFINLKFSTKKHQKLIFGLKNPFFWCSKKKYMKALAEIIKGKISESKEFFGVKI